MILLIPVGFSLLLLQALSELIKRIGFLTGAIPQPFSFGHEKTADEEYAEEMAAKAAAAAPEAKP